MPAAPKTLVQTLPGLRRVLAHLWPYARQHRGQIGMAMLAMLASIGLRLLEPWPLTILIDHVIQVGGEAARKVPLPASLEALGPEPLAALCGVALVVVILFRASAQFANRVGFARVGNLVIGKLRGDVFNHVQRLPLSFHNTARSGDLTLRVIQDVNLMRDAAVTAVLPLLASSLVLVALWSVMFFVQWQLALMALATAPLLAFRTLNLTTKIRIAARKQRKRQGALATTAAESIGAIKNVQALSLEGVFQDEFGTRAASSQAEDVKTARLTANLGRWVDVLIAVSTAVVMSFGAIFVLRGSLSAGELLVFLTYLRRAFNPVKDFAKHAGRLAKATAAGERVLDLLEIESEVKDTPGAIEAAPFRGAVRFEGIVFGYDPKQPVLRELEFDVQPGQRVALVGPSGIGKSTLIDLMLRFYDPQQGRITVDGKDLRDYTLASLRGQISVVLQEALLFAASVRENIAYGAEDCSEERLQEAIRLANASEFIEAMPQGLETVLGERGATLSGGQRQRIAIARALVGQAPILILDEPTTGLDENNRQSVLVALEHLAQGRTTFIVSHDLQLTSGADLILHIEEGRVHESGTHQELLERDGRYAEIYRRQSSSEPHRAAPRKQA
jgi:ATP-binding cassette subfamily B protein